MRRLIIEPEAEQELADARDWYEEQRDGLGAALLSKVDEVLGQVFRRELVTLAVPRSESRCLSGAWSSIASRTPSCSSIATTLSWWSRSSIIGVALPTGLTA